LSRNERKRGDDDDQKQHGERRRRAEFAEAEIAPVANHLSPRSPFLLTPLIGVSRLHPHLHVFFAAEAPDTPLVLDGRVWEAVRNRPGPVHVLESTCEEHQEGMESTVTVEVRRGIFHVQRDDRACSRDGVDNEAR
jgi:hypothetical protein